MSITSIARVRIFNTFILITHWGHSLGLALIAMKSNRPFSFGEPKTRMPIMSIAPKYMVEMSMFLIPVLE
jgi:hypothetical protein